MKKIITSGLAALALGSVALMPTFASAQSRHYSNQHRQTQKNQWKDLTIGAGALGLLGIITHNKTLTWAGLGGAVYSGYRYEEDSKDRKRWTNRDHNQRYDRQDGRRSNDRSSGRRGR